MATQAGFVGRIGNMIHYKMGDRYFTRAAPKKGKQTRGTKKRAGEFGTASTIGRIIRESLHAIIFVRSDRRMQNKLVSTIFEWLTVVNHQKASPTNQPDFDNFKFSPDSPGMSRRWQIKCDVSIPTPGLIKLSIPSFIPNEAFVMPEDTAEIVCRIASVSVDVENKKVVDKAINEIRYKPDANKVAAHQIFQEVDMPPGSLLVTGMSLEFLVRKYHRIDPTNEKAFKPSQIILTAYH